MHRGTACCFFCGRDLPPGEEWLALLNRVICPSCENRLVVTDINDDQYFVFKEKIKSIWLARQNRR